MGQVATRQSRRSYPIMQPAESMPDLPDAAAAARAADVAGQIAYGVGMIFKRRQEEDKIEADGISALNSQVALDKFDNDERNYIGSKKFENIEDYENDFNQYKKSRQEYIKTLLSGKNEDVAQAITNHALKTEVSSQESYYNELDRRKTKFAQTQFFENQNTISQSITPENAEQKKAAMLANIDANKNFFTPAQVSSFKAGIESDINTAMTDYRHRQITGIALKKLDAGGLQEAKDFVMAQNIEIDAKKKIIGDINFEAYQQESKLEIAREENRDEISKLIRSGQSAEAAIENSYLDEKEQWTWFERESAEAARKAKGEPIIPDKSRKGDLRSMAYQIHTGATTIPELKEVLDKAYYDEKIIDESDYDELLAIGEREYKSYQSNAIVKRISAARTQLVDLPSEYDLNEQIKIIMGSLGAKEGSIASEQTRTLRKLQYDNHDRYSNALESWLQSEVEQGKYPTSDEIYIKGRSMLNHYRKTPDELRNEAEMRVAPIKEPKVQEAHSPVDRATDSEFTPAGTPRKIKPKTLPVPKFVMEGSEPQIVYDSEGKELGLKTQNRGIFKIGDKAYIKGAKYEYLGKGNWKAVE